MFLLLMTTAFGCDVRQEPAAPRGDDYAAWTSVTVGVADLDIALDLWVDTFGFGTVARTDGADAELGRLWGIDADDVSRQALIRTGESRHGMIHLVEFRDPDPPVRDGADVFDLLPKNLDVYVADMPARIVGLRERGHRFRTETYSEVTAPDGTRFREIHMPSHDDVNVVLLEVLDEPKPLTGEGYGGVGPLIFIVPDADAEKAFFESVFELDKLNDNLLDGPEIERMVGLPPGAALDVSIWGRDGYDLGGIEIIDYRGVEGQDRYPRARPKARGILHISYVVDDASALRQRLSARSVAVTDHGTRSTLVATGRAWSFASPAGLVIYVYESDDG